MKRGQCQCVESGGRVPVSLVVVVVGQYRELSRG